MGRILEYVVLLSNLSFVLGVQQYKEASHGNNYEREKRENFTNIVKEYFPKEQNDFFNKKVLPLDLTPLRRLSPPRPKQMRTTAGLQAFASDKIEWKTRRRNFSDVSQKSSNVPKGNAVHPFTQSFYARKNSKHFLEIPLQRLSRPPDLSDSPNHQNKRSQDFSRRYHREGRHGRRYPAKICDPCNSVPWIPLLKVSDSYRQQRTHVTELHPTQQQNFNFDYQGFATDTQNVFLPPIPLVPPLEPIYDGTISSSFGLPAGNIPTSHGLLAPINHLTTQATATVDYSSPFNFFSPHGLLESNPFPQLSPVPVVPIHDSGQFYQFDSAIPDLVPPPSQNLDVSKVVLTISEDNLADLLPPKPPLHNHRLNPDPEANSLHPPPKEKNQSADFGRLEIVKSIPLAEFTSSSSSELPLYPPLQSQYSTNFDHKNEIPAHVTDRTHSSAKSVADVTFTTPPGDTSGFSETHSKTEPEGDYSAPRPLTSPSLSWLFSDHTAPPSDTKGAASVSSFVTEPQEIASAVNNELRPIPVSPNPHPLPLHPQNAGNAKSKKIQIIIPYTTKNKNGRDNNALESVRHEVFQPPLSQSTVENDSSRDSANSGPSSLPRTEPTVKPTVIENPFQVEEQRVHESRKYLSDMHHIIASNIRELLREEVEKSQKEQNYSLQNNIDNWTALEYSNHKTLETKAPKEIISHALAVTSIPGTSISHLLLPSKKIPSEYFVTTPVPAYDEPSTSSYKAINSTVHSSPFTAKPYATTNVYVPARGPVDNAKQNKENVPPTANHKKSTEVGRGRVNNWARLNENLVLPEARNLAARTEQTRRQPEKLQIVTPVAVAAERNHTAAAFRRTTRETRRAEDPTTETPARRPSLPGRLNSTRLERVNPKSPFNGRFVYNTTTSQIRNSNTSPTGAERTNFSAPVEGGTVAGSSTGLLQNQTTEEPKLNEKEERLSINDVFPFRNKQLPWESHLNGSENVYRTSGERKSLIKQVNLPKTKATTGSS